MIIESLPEPEFPTTKNNVPEKTLLIFSFVFICFKINNYYLYFSFNAKKLITLFIKTKKNIKNNKCYETWQRKKN
ncbi:hypothetical protein ES705_03732 [subsurface metagenome]